MVFMRRKVERGNGSIGQIGRWCCSQVSYPVSLGSMVADGQDQPAGYCVRLFKASLAGRSQEI